MDYAKLGTYCKVISGYAFKSSDWQDEGIPVIKIGNISNGCDVILDEQTQYVDDVFFEKLDPKYRIEKGDILVSLRVATLTNRILWSEEVVGIIQTGFIF